MKRNVEETQMDSDLDDEYDSGSDDHTKESDNTKQNKTDGEKSLGDSNVKKRQRGDRQMNNKWSQDEDTELMNIVHAHGPKNWKNIAKILGGDRNGTVFWKM